MQNKFNVLSIIRGTTVDGPGFRTSIYLAGCTHKCEGCHNPQSWPFSAGSEMTLEEIMEIVREEDFNVTLSGGDPLCNPESTKTLIEALKTDGRNVWLFTGFTWEEILADATLLNCASLADVVVDGPFIMQLKDPDLLFRGSANQRLIIVRDSLQTNSICLYRKP